MPTKRASERKLRKVIRDEMSVLAAMENLQWHHAPQTSARWRAYVRVCDHISLADEALEELKPPKKG